MINWLRSFLASIWSYATAGTERYICTEEVLNLKQILTLLQESRTESKKGWLIKGPRGYEFFSDKQKSEAIRYILQLRRQGYWRTG